MSFLEYEAACREILERLLEDPPRNRNGLAAIKRTVCKKFKLAEFPRNSDILGIATDDERDLVLPFLLKKPSRTLSGVAVVAVMSKP
ncbi:MAG: tRNA uridine(34) 5-carboxymethylaminomethyl modification radical SAM/GNAT enzyme Elp3, partial [Candidatus Heimdallarchaeota archaeon]